MLAKLLAIAKSKEGILKGLAVLLSAIVLVTIYAIGMESIAANDDLENRKIPSILLFLRQK